MKNKFFIIFFIFISVLIFAQISKGKNIMESGLNNFSNGNYTLALSDFREIILDSNYETLHGTAYYWISRCYMAQNLLDKAENNLDFFIQNFKENKLFPDAVYQKGRLLFRKGQYDSAIQIFYKFIESYSEHPFVSNSYFWIAESLFFLGHLEKAEIIYSMIIREYPNSYKLEASKYKLSLVTLKYRETELLKLLKISHEEYLKALEDFQRR
ncbi:MAG: tetratricopeptide repeat protein, partial [Spirochaetales bacterium]|nr:tetratricopeptide repeat protein [Spirochaetales bacterium]